MSEVQPGAFFKGFDDVLARLSRATFAMLMTVGFFAAAFAFDQNNGNALSKAAVLTLWPMEQLIFRLCLFCALATYMASVLQLTGVVVRVFEMIQPLQPAWLRGLFAFVLGVTVLIIGIVFTAFTIVGLTLPEYRIIGA